MKAPIRSGMALVAAFVLMGMSAAFADPVSDALTQTIVNPANRALQDAMDTVKQQRAQEQQQLQRPHLQQREGQPGDAQAEDGSQQTAQAIPQGQPEKPIQAPSLPRGLNYTADLSIAWGQGNTGAPTRGLMGALDGVVGYGFSRLTRVEAGYYELQEYPIGFSTGSVPLYLQGIGPPISTQSLAGQPAYIKNKLFTLTEQNLIMIGHKLPIIISPAYVSRWGSINGGSDNLLIENNGFPLNVRARTFQLKLLALTVPLISTPHIFASYTIAPQWLVNTGGANINNNPQAFQLLYAEYRFNKMFSAFFQPSELPNYTQLDQYPQHLLTTIYGVNARITPWSFIQLVLENATPTNKPQIGINSITCQTTACSNPALGIGGLKGSTLQLKFGLGSPSVIPL
jgi:hypothetical protein